MDKYYLGFSVFEGIGPVRFRKLLNTFQTAKNAWEAEEDKLNSVLGKNLAASFIRFRISFSINNYESLLAKKNIQYVTFDDKNYPELLKQAANPPFLLYVKGDISLLNSKKIIAIVGTRKISFYGEKVTGQFAEDLVSQGFVIVSGLAFGVDAKAHLSTIENGGKTIAVLGCGVDCCTPSSNQQVYNRILETSGAIVSSFPPGKGASKGSFPARNAIIAGISLGVLVTEGTEDSGALITANDALMLNRPVFAVPGPITSGLSKGPNFLLKKGAVVAVNSTDILDRLGIMSARKVKTPISSDNPDEQAILNILESGPLHFDQIVQTIGKSAQEISVILGMMEVKGIIKSFNGIYSL